MKLSHNDITAFINAIVETPGLIEIRNGRIAWVGKEIVEIAITRDKMGQLWTYTRNPEGENSVILNPFIETIGVENSVRNWFYTYLTSTFGLHLYNCMAFLLQVAANQSDQYPSLIKYNEGLGDVNETLLKELQYLYDSHADGFFSLRYNAKEKCTVPFFGILDPTEEYRKAIPQGKVRKKSWVLLERLLRNIFQQNSEDIVAEYTTCTDSLKCPNFKTYIPSWYRLWRAIEPIIVHSSEDIGVTVNDNLSLIEINLDNIDTFYTMAQWSGAVGQIKSKTNPTRITTAPHDDVLTSDRTRPISAGGTRPMTNPKDEDARATADRVLDALTGKPSGGYTGGHSVTTGYGRQSTYGSSYGGGRQSSYGSGYGYRSRRY